MFHLRRREQIAKVLITLLIGLILYNEFIVYLVQYVKWPKIKCGETREYYKVLLVADPQILGEKTETWIARWDSDRFLAKTFALAVKYVEPDVIVFLGDLMDEGSVATQEQYSRYYNRFSEIFSLKNFPNETVIFVPGDNDIGGEDEEVTSFRVQRFHRNFNQPERIIFGNLDFIKVNKILRTYPVMNFEESRALVTVRIVLSHVPIFGITSYFSSQAVNLIRPAVAFSGHDHKSMHFVGELDNGYSQFVEDLDSNEYASGEPTWRFKIDNLNVNEIVVPTCSYRLGTQDVAFGYALFDKEGETFCYGLLWSPPRLACLVVYLVASPFLVVALLFTHFYGRHHSRLSWFKLIPST